MSAAPWSADHPLVAARARGRFIPHLRNRPIGSETVRLENAPAGGLRLRAETLVAVHRFDLRQTVVAEYAADLRPRACTVEAQVDSRRFALTVEVGRDRAALSSRAGQRGHTAQHDLVHPPLLLIDNCFATHALAALAASQASPGEDTFFSLPAAEDLRATRSPGLQVLLGGQEFASPALTLHLIPELDEHVWLQGGWVGRMIIPQTQMRVEWVNDTSLPGGNR